MAVIRYVNNIQRSQKTLKDAEQRSCAVKVKAAKVNINKMSVWPRTSIWSSRLVRQHTHAPRICPFGLVLVLVLVVVKMIMLKFYNLSRQSQTHSREITNTFETRMWSTKVVVRRARTGYGFRVGEPGRSRGEGGPQTLRWCDEIYAHSEHSAHPANFTCSNLKLTIPCFYGASGWN